MVSRRYRVMSDEQGVYIEVSGLKVGMYVHLDLGWTEHPFPMSSFRLRSPEQIAKIRALGLERVRYSPAQSELEEPDVRPAAPSGPPAPQVPRADSSRQIEKDRRRDLLAEQRASLLQCERQFEQASRQFRQLWQRLVEAPEVARDLADVLVGGMVAELVTDQEVVLRLLSDKAVGDGTLHPVNVSLVALLLGRLMKLDAGSLTELGTAALLHDMGKVELPERMRWSEDILTPGERPLFRQHVARGIVIGERLGLSAGTLAQIAQHHEFTNGAGYPLGLRGDRMTLGGKILAIVNHYDNLCNPVHPAQAFTPHDALAHMFAKGRDWFDRTLMTAFIRMMGVYPPGSVVQLSDGRYALVTTVNSSRPLKPQVLIYQPDIPVQEALGLDLEREPGLDIQRSLSPWRLPKRVFDYLSPRRRSCYFFERARDPAAEAGNL